MRQVFQSSSNRVRSGHGAAALLVLIVGLCAFMSAPGIASAATPGQIEGRVTSASSGDPIEGAEVCLFESATYEFDYNCAFTGPNGEYELEAEEGEYKVEFYDFGYVTQWYSGKPTWETADPVEVEEGEATEGINAALEPEPYGEITGKVTSAATGGSISGIEVCADSTSDEFGGYCEETDSNGEYALYLHSGSYSVLFYSPRKYNENPPYNEEGLKGPNYVMQYYSGKMHRQEADSVTVSDGATTSGINASMQPGATITGTVTDALTGAALQGMDVCAWGPQEFECSLTDANGNYAIPTLPTGAYKVEFQPNYFYISKPEENKEYWQRTEYPLVEYLRQYFNDKFSFATAELVNATGGATTPGISARMTKEFEAPPVGIASVGAKAKVKGGKAQLHVKCGGPGACKGVVELRAKSKPKASGKKKHKKGARIVLIGKAKFSIAAGKSKVVPVKLNGKGKALVRQAGKKGLKATVSGSGVKKGSVLLKGPSKKKHHHKG
jgi:Carboxypeptidase regulatory-like domain